MDLVGNDVVDLSDPANERSRTRARYVDRVLTQAELARFSGDRALFWSLFAAKEAAYKIAAKRGPAPGFAHRRFEVAPDLMSVRDAFTGEVASLRVGVDPARGLVHAVAWTGRVAPVHELQEVAAGDAASDTARRALRERFAAATGLRPGALEVVRAPLPGSWDGFAPPRLHLNGRPLGGVDVSLSHDGRFAAYAFKIGDRIPRSKPLQSLAI